MKTISGVIRDGDPLLDDRGLSPDEIDAMRQRVVSAARRRPMTGLGLAWSRPLAIASIVVLSILFGVSTGDRLRSRETTTPAAAAPASPDATRQLQFTTPGGTRIIWVFDPEFTLKETMP